MTLYTDEIAEFGRLGAANKERYATRHGYEFAAYTRSLDTRRPPAFSKLTAIGNHLKENDWVFWTDADSLVMNSATRLESIIRRGGDKDMILTWEAGGSPVNTGQWLVRNSVWSRTVLERIGAADCPNSRSHWLEQGALVGWLAEDPLRWRPLCLLHPRVMNSTPATGNYPNLNLRASRYRKGDFIIHFWPLARRTDEILRAMQSHDQLALARDGSVFGRLRRLRAAATRIGRRRTAR